MVRKRKVVDAGVGVAGDGVAMKRGVAIVAGMMRSGLGSRIGSAGTKSMCGVAGALGGRLVLRWGRTCWRRLACGVIAMRRDGRKALRAGRPFKDACCVDWVTAQMLKKRP